MRVLSFLTRFGLHRRLGKALSSAQFAMDDMASANFREGVSAGSTVGVV